MDFDLDYLAVHVSSVTSFADRRPADPVTALLGATESHCTLGCTRCHRKNGVSALRKKDRPRAVLLHIDRMERTTNGVAVFYRRGDAPPRERSGPGLENPRARAKRPSSRLGGQPVCPSLDARDACQIGQGTSPPVRRSAGSPSWAGAVQNRPSPLPHRRLRTSLRRTRYSPRAWR
jgi:hypothetical protein